MKIESWVVVRSSQAGVWLGKLAAAPIPAGEYFCVALDEARRAWSWSGATEVAGLAMDGPGPGSKITVATTESLIGGCCEVHAASDKAVERWLAVAPWRA